MAVVSSLFISQGNFKSRGCTLLLAFSRSIPIIDEVFNSNTGNTLKLAISTYRVQHIMAKEAAFLMVVLFGFCLHEIAAIPTSVAECLREHNQVRAKHGAPALIWDATLAAHAQQWANNLKLRGSTLKNVHDPSTNEGENIAMLSNPNCKDAVELWNDESYDYEDWGYCTSAPRQPVSYVMHFTQIVWKSTRKLGVGISGNWLVARYMPPGNAYGRYGRNVQC